MISYDKEEIKEQLTIDNIFELLDILGAEPEYTSFGLTAQTICHNHPGEGSRKLYVYQNTCLCKCFTGCSDTFDVFDLVRKAKSIQEQREVDLNESVRFVANSFGISGTEREVGPKSADWDIFKEYDRLNEIEITPFSKKELSLYDNSILNNLNYNLQLTPWLQDNISQEVLHFAKIGYYLGNDQITIPHFDENNRFIGLRGRTMVKDDAEKYGKYRPLRVNSIVYRHPLGFNLYGLNWAKDNIKTLGRVIVLESEKSVLQYMSYFGIENNIAVACCGSSISNYQMNLLIETGAKEVIIAFDRQFKEINDEEFQHLKKNLLKTRDKYKNDILVSFIFDKNMITEYKASPLDEGKEKFLKLFKERIIL